MDRDGYTMFDLHNKVVKEHMGAKSDGLNLTSDDVMTDVHIANFVAAIRTGEALHAPIDVGAKSVLLCHLGNIAQKFGRKLSIDPTSGRIVGRQRSDDALAAEYAARGGCPWSREPAAGRLDGGPLRSSFFLPRANL